MVKITRCLLQSTHPRKCATSSGLKTTGSFCGFLKGDNLSKGPIPFESDLVKEAKRGNGGVYRVGGQLPLVCQINLVSADVLGPQRIRRLAEVACEQRNLLKIRGLGVRRQIPHLHVFSHPFPKGGHGKLLCEMEGAERSTSMVAQSNFLGNAGRGRGRRHYQPCHAPLPRSGLVQRRLCEAEHYAERCRLSAGFLRVSGSPRS